MFVFRRILVKICLRYVTSLVLQDPDDVFDIREQRNDDHYTACLINPDCHNFLHVTDFRNDDIEAYYNRLLFSLSVPHTISEIKLVSDERIAKANLARLQRSLQRCKINSSA